MKADRFVCAMVLLVLMTALSSLQAQEKHALPATPGDDSSTVSATHAPQAPTLQPRNPRYQLCAGDVFELDFPYTPEFNQTVTVQPDGFIALRGVEEIHVAGQTVPELETTLKNSYKNILHDPVISVVLKEFDKPYYIVGGEVTRPGKFDLRGDTTVIQALQVAGGLSDDAKHSNVYLFRRVSNDWVETTKLNVKKMLNSGVLAEDLHLRPGDMVFVPKSTMGKIRRYIPAPGVGAMLPIPPP